MCPADNDDDRRQATLHFFNFFLQEISTTDDQDQEECCEDEVYDIKEETISIPLNLPPSNITKKRKVDSFMDFVANISKNDDSYFDADKEMSNNCSSKIDLDSDTNFALSLVPMLRAIPLHKKVDAEISILHILKQYMGKGNSSCNISKVVIKEENILSDNESDLNVS